jgi:hypothetical protein
VLYPGVASGLAGLWRHRWRSPFLLLLINNRMVCDGGFNRTQEPRRVISCVSILSFLTPDEVIVTMELLKPPGARVQCLTGFRLQFPIFSL